MKSIKTLVAAIATTSIVSFAVFAHADESKDCDKPDRQNVHGLGGNIDGKDIKHAYMERRHAFFDKILDLTDAQKQTLASARNAQEANIRDAHEKLRNAHEALVKAGDANADDATLSKLSNDLATVMAQQEVARIKARRELLAILTPEQKQKLDTFEAEHKGGPARWKDKRQNTPKAK